MCLAQFGVFTCLVPNLFDAIREERKEGTAFHNLAGGKSPINDDGKEIFCPMQSPLPCPA